VRARKEETLRRAVANRAMVAECDIWEVWGGKERAKESERRLKYLWMQEGKGRVRRSVW